MSQTQTRKSLPTRDTSDWHGADASRTEHRFAPTRSARRFGARTRHHASTKPGAVHTHRHRLSRGGDRAANNALHTITLCRLRHDPRTHAYVAKRTKDGLSKKEIIRCLKRYIAREVYTALQPAHTPTKDLATAA